MDDRILVTNIQRFSLHDGPGIRTTVFLKGCYLRCPWCCNPENIEYTIQHSCIPGDNTKYGFFCKPDELVQLCLKDKEYYGTFDCQNETDDSASCFEKIHGGVTFSGGEVLYQLPLLIPVINELRKAKIHLAVETSLFAPEQAVTEALDSIDFFFVDLKSVDTLFIKTVLKGIPELYFSNLQKVFSWKDSFERNKPVIIRIPVIGGFLDNEEQMNKTVNFLKKSLEKGYKPIKIELLPGHNLGSNKYRLLGLNEPSFCPTDSKVLLIYKERLMKLGIQTEICSI